MTAQAHSDTSTDYAQRFLRVLAHIDAHLDADLSVEELSAVAAFSKYHFHRQFSALFGMGTFKYVQLARLHRASYLLAYREQLRILEIALGSGYDSNEAFSRAFKRTVGQSPSEFRATPNWEAYHEAFQHLITLRRVHMCKEHRHEDVEICMFPGTRIALLVHRGEPTQVGDSVRQFIAWRKRHGVTPRVSATFNILYDDPNVTPPSAYRFGLAASTNLTMSNDAEGVVASEIPSGRCAVLKHFGGNASLFQAVRYLYATWLPTSGHEPGDFPLFLRRVCFYPDVEENAAESHIFLPLR